MNVGFLSDLHVPQLRFFEIGRYPDFIKGDNGKQLLSRLDIQSFNYGFVHFPADWGNDLGVLQVQLRLLDQCPLLLNVRDRSLHSCLRG